MDGKHMKICSISLCIRDMQIKTIMRCHYNPFTKVKRQIIRLIIPSVEDIEQLKLSNTAAENGKCWQKKVWQFLLKNHFTCHSTPRYLPKRN